MGREMPVNLTFVGGRRPPPRTISADPAHFARDDSIRLGATGGDYLVVGRQYVVDANGELTLSVTLRSTGRWFDRLDAAAERRQPVLILVVLLAFAAIIVPVVLFMYFLTAPSDVKRAYAGWAIAIAPWMILAGSTFGLPVLAMRLRKYVGVAISFGFAVVGAFIGVFLALLWSALFIPEKPHIWPADYIRLATDFGQNTSSLIAVCAAYIPATLLILKLLKFDFLEALVSSASRREHD